MNKKVQRNYLEINSVTDLKAAEKISEGYSIQLIEYEFLKFRRNQVSSFY